MLVTGEVVIVHEIKELEGFISVFLIQWLNLIMLFSFEKVVEG